MKQIFSILKWIRKVIIYKIFRLKTFGVRVILLDGNRVLLIKHPYDDFWVFPGGGIKNEESAEVAAIREVAEETSYLIVPSFRKLGEYENNSGGKNDHVTVFVCENFHEHNKKHRAIDEIEIQKCEWFEIENLPNISIATQKRIEELRSPQSQIINGMWN